MAPKKAAKRAKPSDHLEPEVAVRMLDALQTGELSPADLAKAFRADAPGCEPSDKPSAACRGRKDNPNCLCGLVPPAGSFRRKGLWQKDPEAVAKLGIDPADSRREDGVPVGLNNLGNTCYVNAALQCLNSIHAFREAIFGGLEGASNAGNPIIHETRQLLAHLNAGPRASADPTAFARTLALDHSVQQDGQEFMKLLLTLLERLLRESGNKGVQEVVPDLFRGQYAYETTCQACGQPSASSSRLTDFYELDINIRGFPSLAASLASYLEAEVLCGDNQYFCERCARKVDARRQVALRALPPYLCLSLQRFYFKPETGTKVKASDKFSFPLALDLGALVSPTDGSQHPGGGLATGTAPQGGPAPDAAAAAGYELVAILVHKGSSASHGHYVAHVRSEGSGNWWRYDDSEVTRMATGPAGEHADHGVAADKRVKAGKAADSAAGNAAAAGEPAGPEAVEVIDLEAEPEPPAAAPATSKAASGRSGGSRGGGRQRAPKRKGGGGAATAATTAATAAPNGLVNGSAATGHDADGAAPMELADGEAGGSAAPADSITSANAYLLVYRRTSDAPQPPPPQLPASLSEDMEAEQQKFDEACATFQTAKQAALAAVHERREAVRQTLQLAPAPPGASEDARWVDAAWLGQWADGAEASPPIDNAPLLCEHGKLDPSKAAEGKRVALAAWRALQGAHRGGPELALADACLACLDAKLQGIAAAQDASQARGEVLALLDTAEAGSRDNGAAPPGSLYVSASWLAGFRRRGGRSIGAAAPTDGVACPHGALLPESRGGRARRATVPPPVWAFLREAWAAEQHGYSGKDAAGSSLRAPSEDEVIVLDSPRGRQDEQPAEPSHSAAAEAGQPPPLPEFRVGSAAECSLCASGLASDMQQHQGVRSQAALERQALGHLAAGTPLALQPGGSYRLAPRGWLAAWRAHLQAAAKRGAASPLQQPSLASLADTQAAAFCSCHGGEGTDAMLAHRPPPVALKRGKWQTVPDDGDAFFEVVTSEDWAALQGFHAGGQPLRDIAAQLMVDSPAPSNRGTSPATAGNAAATLPEASVEAAANGGGAGGAADGTAVLANGAVHTSTLPHSRSCSPAVPGARPDEAVIGDDLKMVRPRGAGFGGGRGASTGRLACDPPVCEASLQAAAAAAKAARLTYAGAEIMVALVTEAEATAAPDAAAAPGPAAPAAGERRSRRARRGRAPLTVASDELLQGLKLRVLEALGVDPRNAAIYVRGRLLDNDDATLAECEIYPREEVRVLDRGIYGEDDIGSLFSGAGSGPATKRERERGFSGTALAGGGGGGGSGSSAKSDADAVPAPAAAAEAAAAGDSAAAAGLAAGNGSGQQPNGCGGGGGGGAAAAMQTEALEQLSDEALQPDVAAAAHQAGLDDMSAEDRAAVMAAMMS